MKVSQLIKQLNELSRGEDLDVIIDMGLDIEFKGEQRITRAYALSMDELEVINELSMPENERVIIILGVNTVSLDD